jgi:hypothetical protein
MNVSRILTLFFVAPRRNGIPSQLTCFLPPTTWGPSSEAWRGILQVGKVRPARAVPVCFFFGCPRVWFAHPLNPLTAVTSLRIKLFHVLNTTINIKDTFWMRWGNNQIWRIYPSEAVKGLTPGGAYFIAYFFVSKKEYLFGLMKCQKNEK